MGKILTSNESQGVHMQKSKQMKCPESLSQ